MPRASYPPRVALLIGLLTAVAAGCSSDGYSGSSNSSVHSSFYYSNGWYNDPYYYGYYPPGVVVVPPPVYPGQPVRPVSPEQPIARPPGGATTPPRGSGSVDPACAAVQQRGTGPSTRPAPSASTSSRSRMPSSQPRMSSSSRASIPRAGRGGGGRRR
jgi:hypothetical protein